MKFQYLLNKIIRRSREILSHRYLWGRAMTFHDFCSKNSVIANYTLIQPSRHDFVTPVCYVYDHKKENIDVLLREKYIVEITDAQILGKSNLVWCNRCILYDQLLLKDERERITDKGLLQILNNTIHIDKLYFPSYVRKGKDINTAISLCGNFSGNLYHFVYEILSKFYILDSLNFDDSIPILFDESVQNVSQLNELARLFAGNHPILYINAEELIKVKKCYIPSFCHVIPMNYKNMFKCKSEDVKFDRTVLKYLRKKILAYSNDKESDYPKKFFISRKRTKWRSYNEDEVINTVRCFGFEVVFPEDMTYNQQITLFKNAVYIIAASGAALTNMICCSPNCKILTLISTRLELSIFSTIADTFSIELKYFEGLITSNKDVQSEFFIDCNKLKNYLEYGE